VQFLDFDNLAESGLTIITFGNFISSWKLGDSV
jgi:hypothetical protein